MFVFLLKEKKSRKLGQTIWFPLEKTTYAYKIVEPFEWVQRYACTVVNYIVNRLLFNIMFVEWIWLVCWYEMFIQLGLYQLYFRSNNDFTKRTNCPWSQYWKKRYYSGSIPQDYQVDEKNRVKQLLNENIWWDVR